MKYRYLALLSETGYILHTMVHGSLSSDRYRSTGTTVVSTSTDEKTAQPRVLASREAVQNIRTV
jgi:hypothetical protein